jgi:hypothetical protein
MFKYRTSHRPLDHVVRQTLADHPGFVPVGQGRWQLGEPGVSMPPV